MLERDSVLDGDCEDTEVVVEPDPLVAGGKAMISVSVDDSVAAGLAEANLIQNHPSQTGEREGRRQRRLTQS